MNYHRSIVAGFRYLFLTSPGVWRVLLCFVASFVVLYKLAGSFIAPSHNLTLLCSVGGLLFSTSIPCE